MTTNGIDVSHFQGNINWQLVKTSGIDFAFIKATDGVSDTDPKFLDNWRGASQENIKTGAYHFFRPNENPEQQAQHFINTIKQAGYNQENLPPALDVEISDDVPSEILANNVFIILNKISEQLKITPAIYTTASFWNSAVQKNLSQYPLWIADWENGQAPALPQDWNTWTYWQYTSRGEIQGINGPVDLNRVST